MWIHFSTRPTFSWPSAVVVCFKNSLTFTQDVTDASVNTCWKLKLVFLGKRLWFSGRQYFEIRWGFYIKLKVSWLRAFLWCMSQTSRVIETIAVVYKLNSRKELRRNCSPIEHNNTKHFFVPNQEPGSAWSFGNSSVRVGTQGLFRPYLKTFVPPFFLCPTDWPWVSEDGACRAMYGYIWICSYISTNVKPLYDAYTTYLPMCSWSFCSQGVRFAWFHSIRTKAMRGINCKI